MSNFDFEEEGEIQDLHFNFDFGYEVNPLKSPSKRPTVSYLYLDFNDGEFKFNTKHFTKKDSKIYLKKMNLYAQKSLKELIDNSTNDEHFTVNANLTKKELSLLTKLMGDKEISEENIPILGHFALYTEKYEEGKETKAPRIFFLVGEQSIMHILFYDPFHKIHPISEKTRNAIK